MNTTSYCNFTNFLCFLQVPDFKLVETTRAFSCGGTKFQGSDSRSNHVNAVAVEKVITLVVGSVGMAGGGGNWDLFGQCCLGTPFFVRLRMEK